MRIIPAIDIIDGQCVRLTQGNYADVKVYRGDPFEVAKEFEDHGFKWLHLVDLDGAKGGGVVHHKILKKIATKTRLKVDFGGGIKRTCDLEQAFEHGADRVTVGSVALHNPSLFLTWVARFGADKVILGADAKDRTIVTNGWIKSSSQEVLEFIKEYVKKGVQRVVCTNIRKDGMLSGPDVPLYKAVLALGKVQLIASGGISCLEDVKALKRIGCEGSIIGKAIYEGKIDLKSLGKLC